MDAIEKINLNGVTIDIYVDESPENPRDWDNLGVIVGWHRRYTIGDKHNHENPADFKDWAKSHPSIVLPVYMYDHSGIALSTSNSCYPFNDMWDAGQVGYIFVEISKVKSEFNWHNLTRARIEKINKILQAELQEYAYYINGEVYGFINTCDVCGEELDSCWGFFGSNWKENGLMEYASGCACDACKQTAERLTSVCLV